jgi:S1-C subfamily serine protease
VRLTRGASPAAPVADGEAPGDERARSRVLGSRTRVALAAALVTGVVVGGIVLATTDSPAPLDAAQVGTIASDVAAKAIKDQQAAPATSAVVYQRILPSLVAVEAKRPATKKDEGALGTGVIVNARGAILTAFHVVDGATRIRVSFVDGTRSRAEIAATDPENDIAVLVAERAPEVIVPAVFGGGPQVGDEAYAVGHPFGYIDSLTSGVISGLGRQPRELRRAAAQPRRAGNRHRHRPGEPVAQRLFHRHQLRGPHRHRGRCGKRPVEMKRGA